jgi:hypothetical protein
MISLGGMLSLYKVHFLKAGKNPGIVTNPLSTNMQKKKTSAAAYWSREGYRQVQGQPSVDLWSFQFTIVREWKLLNDSGNLWLFKS